MKFKKSFMVCRQDEETPIRAIFSTPTIPDKCGFKKGVTCDLDKNPARLLSMKELNSYSTKLELHANIACVIVQKMNWEGV